MVNYISLHLNYQLYPMEMYFKICLNLIYLLKQYYFHFFQF